MIKYLGSKRTLVPRILEVVRALDPDRRSRVLDLFSGTARVAHALKRDGRVVVANDHNAYALALARCYVETDAEPTLLERVRALVAELNALAEAPHPPEPREPGYVERTYGLRSRFFHPDNGRRIDALRERIASWGLDAALESVLLVSLMEAADRVDSTTGLQMAYLKSWAPRALKPLRLRVPELLARPAGGGCAALGLDALEAAGSREARGCDIAYIDPPYNQHSYLSNYHIWETLVRWDRPAVYGRACKREDCRTRKSLFNARHGYAEAFGRLIGALPASTLVVSFSSEGFLSRVEAEEILSARGRVTVLAHDFPRYVGARIGIYNPAGRKVGVVGALRNTEYLFVVTPPERAVPAALLAMADRVRTGPAPACAAASV